MSVPVLCYTCDSYAWALKPFAYLMGVMWSQEQPVYVCGTRPFPLPPSFIWLDVESRVAARWSDGLIEALHMVDGEVFVWMLEDYWLCRTVDCAAVESLAEYMYIHPDILKIDLTADRLHSSRGEDIDYWGRCDIIQTDWDTPYNWSTQSALWRKSHLLSFLRPEMSPWDFELRDDKPQHLRVCGTRSWPVRYVNGAGMGLEKDEYRTIHTRHGLGGTTVEAIPADHLQIMRAKGLFPGNKKERVMDK